MPKLVSIEDCIDIIQDYLGKKMYHEAVDTIHYIQKNHTLSKKQSKEFEEREGQISSFYTIQRGKHKTSSLQQAEEDLIEKRTKKQSIWKFIKWILIWWLIIFSLRFFTDKPYIERCWIEPSKLSYEVDLLFKNISYSDTCPCYGMNIPNVKKKQTLRKR